jgi:hypothetical protein
MLAFRILLSAVWPLIGPATMTISSGEFPKRAISDPASCRGRRVAIRSWRLLRAAALCVALSGLLAMVDGSAHAGGALEAR